MAAVTICSDFASPQNKATGAAVAQRWSDFEGISHLRGQMGNPSKMVGGLKLRLESSPIPARDAQRAHTNLVPILSGVYSKNKKHSLEILDFTVPL